MDNSKIIYSSEHPFDFTQLQLIYEAIDGNSLNFTVEELEKMCKQSWFAMYAFDGNKLVGMGRIISDGVIIGLICGVCVLPAYQSQGIGKEIIHHLVGHCEKNRVFPQLMCVEGLEPYYGKLGFERFTIGMRKKITR